MHSLISVVFLSYFIAWCAFKLIRSFRAKNDPRGIPGPTLFPLIGRVHDLPAGHLHTKFSEWADQYGQHGFFRTEMMGDKFLVVHDEKVVEDLLVKRGKINSDRPAFQSVVDSKSTDGGMEYLPLMGKNKYWARQRRVAHSYLSQSAHVKYNGILYHETKHWLTRLITDPDSHSRTVEDMCAKIMGRLTWDDASNSEVNMNAATELLIQISPAGPITNLVTPLWELPFHINPWKMKEAKRRARLQKYWTDNFLAVKRRLEEGQLETGALQQCWVSQELRNQSKSILSGDYEVACCLGMLSLLGILTIAGPVNHFLIAMVHHPEWQKKVQQEIDEQCEGKLPVLEDLPRLPILRAIIKETLRWKVPIPTGVGHETEEDQYYQGYLIEKGTRILPFEWKMVRNPIKYPDPFSFRPERWLESSWPTFKEPLTKYPTVKGMSSFGWGPRQCIGQSLVQDAMLVVCGALLWCFNLKQKIDPVTQKPVEIPTNKGNSLLITKPQPYLMAFEPRSEQRRLEAFRLWEESREEDRRKRGLSAPTVSFPITEKKVAGVQIATMEVGSDESDSA